ncbi:hypothetical protein PoB_002784900 [Plakobranchus ocellatus]|uniref:Uncharacterized protein n=1 Tax=Plakobranchus ocellatus TaxID=259542 RepID=A0AAV4A417_9GAST|nr:hypothetical protein PoB_002784900 [Plakobranchus ocellatus]
MKEQEAARENVQARQDIEHIRQAQSFLGFHWAHPKNKKLPQSGLVPSSSTKRCQARCLCQAKRAAPSGKEPGRAGKEIAHDNRQDKKK